MLKPHRNRIIFSFFSWYISRIIKTDFRKVEICGAEFDRERPILLLANHLSWWDGFIMFHINKIYFRKKFHVMISEENYHKVWFLKYMGAFSVNKNSRTVIETLRYAGGLLNDPGNLVLVFPQGQLYSGHVDEISFQKGLITLVNNSAKKFQYVFAATFFDYFAHRQPGARCYLQTWDGGGYTSLQVIKNAYNKFYQSSRRQQNTITV